jgi:putative ABC transport system substrate-binding protein
VKRRDFITLLGGAAAWPLAARAQQAEQMRRIGVLMNRAADIPEGQDRLAAFHQGLQELGWRIGHNVRIDTRWSADNADQSAKYAAELVALTPDIILASGAVEAHAAKVATASIPIVFATGEDPVKVGLVASLNRPGGNLTGISFYYNSADLHPKQLEFLREVVPKAAVIGLLVNPAQAAAESQKRNAQVAARALGAQILVVGAGSERDFDMAFATLAQQGAGALLIAGSALFTGQRDQLVALAARFALPTIYPLREFVAAGGLMSYGTSITDAYRLAGIYASRILKGEKPADLPVTLPTKFELVINLKTVKALGLTVPDKLLVAADEVIE